MNIKESQWNACRDVLSDKIQAFEESCQNRSMAVGYREGINAAYRAIREELDKQLRPGAA